MKFLVFINRPQTSSEPQLTPKYPKYIQIDELFILFTMRVYFKAYILRTRNNSDSKRPRSN